MGKPGFFRTFLWKRKAKADAKKMGLTGQQAEHYVQAAVERKREETHPTPRTVIQSEVKGAVDWTRVQRQREGATNPTAQLDMGKISATARHDAAAKERLRQAIDNHKASGKEQK